MCTKVVILVASMPLRSTLSVHKKSISPHGTAFDGRFVVVAAFPAQIANVGFEYVNADALSNAVAGDTLFIHGSSVEGGSRALSSPRRKLLDEALTPEVSCEAACGNADSVVGDNLPTGISTVCDASCDTENRFDGHLCGAGDSTKFGSSCRACYTDQQAALRAEAELRKWDVSSDDTAEQAKHVIMCDTMRPPPAMDCSAECSEKSDTVSFEH